MNLSSPKLRILLFAVIVVGPTLGGNLFAGISYVSQERLVFGGAGSPRPTQSAVGFGPFDADVSGQETTPGGDGLAARVTQSSRLLNDGIRASGSVLAASGADEVLARALVSVTFDLDEPTSYRLAASAAYPEFHPNGNRFPFTPPDFALLFHRVGPGGPPIINQQYNVTDISDLTVRAVSVDQAGVLATGRYELRFDLRSTVFEDSVDGTYNLRFTTSPVNAVPLPSAAWGGLLMLGGLAGGQWRVARRARRGTEGQ